MARQKPNVFVRTMPIIDWLPHYQRSWLPLDLLAGLSVWALVIPQALAYAAVVGVPAQYGLYTILGASTLYAVFAATHAGYRQGGPAPADRVGRTAAGLDPEGIHRVGHRQAPEPVRLRRCRTPSPPPPDGHQTTEGSGYTHR